MDRMARIKELGLELPERAPPPIAAYVAAREAGGLLFVSGQGPTGPDGRGLRGKAGVEVDLEEATRRARLTGINLLAAVRDHCGDLERVEAVVKLLGMVNAPPDFTKHPLVIDGCSRLLLEVFG
ncbi:MAG: RidA family protein, partial [Betaproteobacteria bacterium AqS2]|nr:RidA family protein [Betaproteobacteria bacterium AqS2]